MALGNRQKAMSEKKKIEELSDYDVRLEDSANGVKAGVAAGMNVIAWGTPFTIAGLHASRVLEHTWVVHDPEKLVDTVKERIAEHNRTGHQ